jgi:selenocysteine lyase/cysteine desulfurase
MLRTANPTAAPHAGTADPIFAELRRREFARLDRAGIAYLDYTGSALVSARQLRLHRELLASEIFGNPHADSAPSRLSTDSLERARSLLLAHLDADDGEYTVCFTANASGAVKLVAESYPFGRTSAYVLSADNHNSLNGVREYARRSGARVAYVPLDADLRLRDVEDLLARNAAGIGPRLFAFPAQSNFSGVVHPLALVGAARAQGYDVLLDAAAFLPTHALSLREQRPDFVVLSFYKLFGYPTGLGALVARRDALARLVRPWFAGGTVEYVSVQNDMHSLIAGANGFEDGTPDFLGIAALAAGFSLLDEIGVERIGAHVRRLTAQLFEALSGLKNHDGSPVVRLYGPRDMTARGATIAFNVLRRDGHVVPYWDVDGRARAAGVALRGGCFCNPGAAEAAFGFEAEAAGRCLRQAATAGPFTIPRFAACLSPDGEIAVGAVRASLGMANNDADVERAVAVIESFGD